MKGIKLLQSITNVRIPTERCSHLMSDSATNKITFRKEIHQGITQKYRLPLDQNHKVNNTNVMTSKMQRKIHIMSS